MLKDYYNEIIPPWDSRYGKIGHMWKKNHRLTSGEGRNLIKYYIPRELIVEEYITSKVEVTKLSTDWEYNNWISSRSTTRIIEITCKLTPQEFYDITYLRINNKSDRPRCAYCKNPLTFTYLSNGYAHHSWDMDRKDLCCSISCSLNLQNKLGSGMNSMDSNIRKAYSQFVNKGSLTDKSYLYVALLSDNSIKYGITTDLNARIILEYLNDNEIISLHKLYSGPRIKVANIEMSIKYRLGGKEYLPYSSLRQFLNLVKYYLTDHR